MSVVSKSEMAYLKYQNTSVCMDIFMSKVTIKTEVYVVRK